MIMILKFEPAVHVLRNISMKLKFYCFVWFREKNRKTRK